MECRSNQTVHQPISDTTRQIRLLEILSAGATEEVECSLSIYEIDSAPPYTAISYNWGYRHPVQDVLINRTKIGVRTNCCTALRLARFHCPSLTKHVWIDAICIDQLNVLEKNHQVRLMSEIYTRASFVLVSIGPIWWNGSYLDLDSELERVDAFLSLTCAEDGNIADFLGRLDWKAYWKRLWVVQEYLLAPSGGLYVAIGKVLFDCASLHSLLNNRRTRFPGDRLVNGSMGALCLQKYRESHADITTPTSRTLGGLLETHWSRECDDIQDRVFALLALVDWTSPENVMYADYTKSAFDIGLDCLQHEVSPLIVRKALRLHCDIPAVRGQMQRLSDAHLVTGRYTSSKSFSTNVGVWASARTCITNFSAAWSYYGSAPRAADCEHCSIETSVEVVWVSKNEAEGFNSKLSIGSASSYINAGHKIRGMTATCETRTETQTDGIVSVLFALRENSDLLDIEMIWVPWVKSAALALTANPQKRGTYKLACHKELASHPDFDERHAKQRQCSANTYAASELPPSEGGQHFCGLILQGTDDALYMIVGPIKRPPAKLVRCNAWLDEFRINRNSLFNHINLARDFYKHGAFGLDIPIFADPQDIMVAACQDIERMKIKEKT